MISIRRSSLADNGFSREQAAITLVRHLYIKTDHIFIYEVMPLTCGIQAFYDNNRVVWFTSGLCSAGQQLQHRLGLWDDVTALQNRQNQFVAAAEREREEAGGSRRLWCTWTHTHTHFSGPPGTNRLMEVSKCFGPLGIRCCYIPLPHEGASLHHHAN